MGNGYVAVNNALFSLYMAFKDHDMTPPKKIVLPEHTYNHYRFLVEKQLGVKLLDNIECYGIKIIQEPDP